jgi:hypothetical protein
MQCLSGQHGLNNSRVYRRIAVHLQDAFQRQVAPRVERMRFGCHVYSVQ